MKRFTAIGLKQIVEAFCETSLHCLEGVEGEVAVHMTWKEDVPIFSA